MNDELILLGLRFLAGGSLLAFMGLVVYFLHRDYRAAAVHTQLQPTVRGWVRVMHGGDPKPDQGERLPLSPLTTIGRAPTSTIQIDDQFVSNEHATLMWKQGQWWLQDQASSNGTHINGLELEEPIVLSAGDIISIGDVELRLELE